MTQRFSVRFSMSAILIGGFVGLALAVHARRHTAKDERPQLLEAFTLSTIYQDTQDRFQALYIHRDQVARVDIQRGVSRADATALIQQRINAMHAIYENHLSPYPGELSNEIVCEERFKPTFETHETHGMPVHVVQGLATARFTFGACADDLIAYKGLMAWYWCPASQSLIQLELMIPKADTSAEAQLRNALTLLACRRR